MKNILVIAALLLSAVTANAGATRVIDAAQIKNGAAVITMPTTSGTLCGKDETCTLTNKTLTAPAISSPTGLVKGDVGLGSVDNTSDLNKPISTATQSALDAKVSNSEKGANNGVATLDGGGKVTLSQLPNSIMTYEGVWNATTNSPTLADGSGNAGQVYRVSVAGTQDLGSGNITFAVGDYAILNSSLVWEKADTTDSVVSVNGQTGVVTIVKADVGLGNVDNTSDATKNAATATLTNKTIDGGSNTLTNVAMSSLTGTLGVSKGGTGQASLTAGSLVVGNGTSAVTSIAPGSNGEVLTVSGGAWVSAAAPSSSSDVSGSQASPTLISAGSGISFAGSNYHNIKYIAGNGGAVDITANPQIAAGSVVGQSLTIITTSATDTVTLEHGNGLSLNGTWVGDDNSSIQLNWNGSVWTEVSRR